MEYNTAAVFMFCFWAVMVLFIIASKDSNNNNNLSTN
jgi:hypothetical protein